MSGSPPNPAPAATPRAPNPAPVYRGIIPPIVTPLLGRDALDEGGLERLIEHLIAGGVHGIFVLGTTGEAPSLSHRLRREMVALTLRRVAGRTPVLVGITDTSFIESVELARFAAEAGASAVVMAPPYYHPAGQPELVEFLEDLVAELTLPLFLYNMPSLTKVSFEIPTVARAMQMDRVIGIKDSSGNMILVHRLIELARGRTDWSVLIGAEELTAEAVLFGAQGGITGGANVCPRLYVDLFDAAAAGDLVRLRELQPRVLDVAGALYTVGRHSSAGIKGLKCALSLLGICSDALAEPFRAFREPERELMRGRLEQLGLLSPASRDFR